MKPTHQVLKDDTVHTFRGLYALRRGASATNSGGPYVDAEKIAGKGPRRFDEPLVKRFLKYDSSGRSFAPLPSKSFTFTTDAVVLAPSAAGTAFRARPAPCA